MTPPTHPDPASQPAQDDLSPFFAPRGVAVVGASQDPTKLGYGLARNLVQSNYQGVVHFINPKGGSLLGRPMVPGILQAPDPVDLAILLIPAPAVPQALHECGQRGLKAAIIASGGFRETGAEGAALEAECLRVARSYGIRLIGPNCIGMLDTHLPIDTTFLPPPGPLPGDVAFISHSGAICAAVIDWARGQSFGLSRLVSLGNQVDVTETDVLAPVAADRFTRVLTLYLEGVSDGRRFIDEASQVARHKPIIALKVGRFASGQRAVASHTGALAGQESAFNAAFRRAGVIRAETSEEMFDWARALAWCPPPQGRAVAVLTNAGGPGVTASDALESNGMRLAELSPSTLAALQAILPPAASLHNPVDMLASASPEQYAQSLRLLLEDPEVDAVMVILPPPPMYTAGAVAKAVIPVIHNAAKPVVIALMGERLIQEAVEHFRAARVPEYRFPERAASALAVLAQRAEHLARVVSAPAAPSLPPGDIFPDQARSALEAYRASAGQPPAGDFLPPEVVEALLAAYGIRLPAARLAGTPRQAVELARQIGFPVALKIDSPDIPHKSDVGGVLLDLADEDAVARGFSQVMANARQARPEAQPLGVRVQRMLPAGQEVILGAIQDRQFGPLVMFGSGGVEVEGLKDVSFALAPLTSEESQYLLDRTWAGRKLKGYRNLPPADRGAVLDTLMRLGQLAADFPEIAEIEINPLRVLAAGQGALVLDVRARLAIGG
jgi:acetyltransferase